MGAVTERPDWTRDLLEGLNTVLDHVTYHAQDDVLHDRIETAVRVILCDHYGHDIIDDQCMIPDHRYCVWCGRRETAIKEEA